MARLLIDTSVLLDYAMGREPGCSSFVKLVELAGEGRHSILVASVSLKECYYVISSSLKAANRNNKGEVSEGAAAAATEIAWAQISTLIDLVEVVNVGMDECLQAQAYRPLHNDFEGNLILAAARSCKADYLVTGDAVLQKHAPLACLDSEAILAILA